MQKLNLTGLAQTDNLFLGIRPENIIISSKGQLDGKVKLVSNMGSENIIYVGTADTEVLVKANKETQVSEGNNVKLNFERKNLFIFDKSNGERIEIKQYA